MKDSSKNFVNILRRFVRRIVLPPVRELSRTGKIVQTLWDAAQLQSQQRSHYQKIGEIAQELVKSGQLQNHEIERTMAKIDQVERVLQRQELLLKSYQTRGDVREVLKQERQRNQESLEPV